MRTIIKAVVLSSAVFSLVNCSKETKTEKKDDKKPQPYQYIVVSEGNATNFREFPARIEGIKNIEIRPKIDGFIENVYVDEGSSVTKGQSLFRIRNPQYEQLVRVADASILSAQADVATAEMQVQKTRPLVDKKIISAYELKAAQLALQAKKAALAQAQANRTNAQVNQGYTLITSPVTGVVGSLPFKTGSYINSSSQPLTTVSDISNIYAYFSINEKDQLEFLKHSSGASVAEKLKNSPMVNLILSDGSLYNEKGRIESLSGQVDPGTGSFTMRASFPNPNGLLRSGYSGTVQLPNYLEKIVIIPQKATYELQGKTFVYLVGNDKKVKSTEIKVKNLPDGLTYAVESGLKPGDKVVVEGFGLLKDGTEIIPKETNMQSVINPENSK